MEVEVFGFFRGKSNREEVVVERVVVGICIGVSRVVIWFIYMKKLLRRGNRFERSR